MSSLNIEYISPPYQFYDVIKKFYKPLFDEDICFEEEEARNFNRDGYVYRMIYCKYDEFKKDYFDIYKGIKW